MLSVLRFAAVAAAGVLAVADAADPCTLVNFYEQSDYLSQVNNLLAIAPSLLPTFLSAYDPLVLHDQALNAQSFSALGSSFAITPTITFANASGLLGVAPRQINVTSANSLQIGTDFSSTLQVQATVSLEIQQLNHKWFQPCWTSPLHPHECPAKTVGMNFEIGLEHPSAVVNAIVDLAGCPANATTCSDVSIGTIIGALASGSYAPILHTILQRFKDVFLQSVTLEFDAISALSFSFTDTGSLIDAIESWLLTFSKDAINKKGDVYHLVTDVVDSIVDKLLNNLITEKLAPQFGNTCYAS